LLASLLKEIVMLRNALEFIAQNYLRASHETFKGHVVGKYIRNDAAKALSQVVNNPHYIFKGSAGQSRWADVPWLAVLDPTVTEVATRGYYVVYLFSANMKRIYLCLGQATTQIEEEFKSGADDELKRRAALIRDRLPEAGPRFRSEPISLEGTTRLARTYEPAVALHVEYSSDNLPTEEHLQQDLLDAVRLYSRLIARGGRDNFEEADEEKSSDQKEQSVEERRRYTYHRKIERSAKAAREAKKEHGVICQCCGFDFAKVFGELGDGYIEAHHLTPLSELPEDVPVTLDPKTDFAVLCANCHRMIHRKDAPKTVAGLRAVLRR
jgi:5-methylcytosine-specific restriction protein A